MRKLVDQQLRHNDCGISAIKTVCNVLGVNIGRGIIEEQVPMDNQGATLNSIQQFFDNHGFSTNYKLLDVNSLNGNQSDIQEILPAIVPIKSEVGLHYVVIDQLRNKKFHILDPNEDKSYKLNLQEFKKKAFFTDTDIEFIALEEKLKVAAKHELEKRNLPFPPLTKKQDLLALFNKLTYFSYLVENFGFKNEERENAFLKDLVFNQDLTTVPEHFRSLSLKDQLIQIKAPILLSIKKTELTQEEETEATSNPYIRLIKSIRNIKDIWAIFLVTTIVASIITYLSVFINQILIDHILPSYQLNTLMLFAIGVGIFYIFDLLFRIYKKFISIHLGNALDRYFFSVFDQKLNNYSIMFLQSFNRGDLTERLSDSFKLKTFFLRFFSKIFVNVIIAVFSLSILLVLSWKLTIIVFVVLLSFIAIFYIITPIIKSLERKRFSKKAEFFSKFIEKIDGIQVIKALRLEPYSTDELRSRFDELIKIKTKAKYVGLANSTATSLIITFSTLTILIMTSREMILFNSLTLGMIITYLALSGKIFSSFGSLLDANLDIQEHQVILNRFFDFREYKKDDSLLGSTKNKKKPKAKNSLSENMGKIKDAPFESLQVQNVSFSYIESKMILNDINLEIKKGERIYIQGENGSGKSTFCKIIGLLYEPSSGNVLFNGLDFELYDRKKLANKVVFVSGEDLIFNDSLLFNITFGRSISIETLIEYAKVLNFYDFINEKPEKFNYVIQENGRNLSTGQRRKLLLLRALMTDADLIILDEIFNGMDKFSKDRAEVLLDFIPEKAFVIISHIPLNNLRLDKKYLLENGRLLNQTT
ncbi:MAG: ATP-binding cassette domain-containing protein [Bacteroidetes bacterium]|nr:ATP-binding cassette domain-containing protein [Bacteroidota bacterium]